MTSTARCPRRRRLLLLALLQLTPILALAALAPFDLTGTARRNPATLGALEASADIVGVAAPTGLALTIHRNGE